MELERVVKADHVLERFLAGLLLTVVLIVVTSLTGRSGAVYKCQLDFDLSDATTICINPDLSVEFRQKETAFVLDHTEVLRFLNVSDSLWTRRPL